ncbi:MAG: S8 family serine peptidase [Lacipirellulaceae bacterium]
MPKSKTDTNRLNSQIESLEERLAMTANPLTGFLGGGIEHHSFDEPPVLNQHVEQQIQQQVERTADFWRDPTEQVDLDSYFQEIDQHLNSAHNTTGLNDVREDYGFRGNGQTVVVIDSGIAYDHYALGGGFGSDYRVVGGYDFTGWGDDDPYDSGPSGSHGTHVAGIIGSTDSTHEGVAPGADLVGLRVFDDDGNGYFHWVESALQWVHQNKDAFENPITAVNLSLGVSNWNSSAIPGWANLENEFAQLEADGIFIAVSAGNSYQSFNAPGLSYPAASPYVIPVMSVDDSGNLSYYSQRHDRAIAAPGRSIYSTVPDYNGNNNGVTDDFRAKSGTSMASPYVAGASILVREAMEFVGQTGITQDTIFDHMIATADSFFDSASNSSYSRLNIQAAIDALMPTDDYGDSAGAAHSLGTITDTASVSGVISKIADADYFSFTAGSTGTVSFTATNMTHELAAQWTAVGGTVSGANGETITLDVVAGQTYTVGLGTSDGLGYFDIDVTAESSFSFVDWGAFLSGAVNDVVVAGEGWYRVEASQNGYMTVQAAFDAAGGDINLELYNENLELIDAGATRVDVLASSGEAFYVHAVGTNADVDFQMTNLVNLSGGVVTVTGTSGDDNFSFTAGSTYNVSVNDVAYDFSLGEVSTVNFDGGSGTDVFVAYGSTGDETGELREDSASLTGANYTVTATSVEQNTLHGGGGSDTVAVYDTAGDDIYRTYVDRVEMSLSTGNVLAAHGFAVTHGYASTGQDEAFSYDSAGDDLYRTYADRTVMSGSGFSNETHDFDKTYAYASTGHDQVTTYDSAGDDLYRTWHDRVIMSGDGYYNYAGGFDQTTAQASTGYDLVYSYDSDGDDLYRAWADRVVLSGDGFSNYAAGFDRSYVYGSTGNDVSYSYDSDGDDVLRTWADRSVLSGDGFYNYVQNFDRTYTYGTNGDDRAYLYDSAGDDLYRGWADRAVISGDHFYNYVQDFDRTYAYASTGNDIATVYDSAGDDLFRAWSDRTVMSGDGFYNYAQGFDQSTGNASTGNDTATFYDSIADDSLLVRDWGTRLSGTGFSNTAAGFDNVSAHAVNGGDNDSDIEAVDYIFSSVGAW